MLQGYKPQILYKYQEVKGSSFYFFQAVIYTKYKFMYIYILNYIIYKVLSIHI